MYFKVVKLHDSTKLNACMEFLYTLPLLLIETFIKRKELKIINTIIIKKTQKKFL